MIAAAAKKLARDCTGISAVEFAMVAPAFFMTLIGVFDLGQQIYVANVLDGAMSKAGRDASLETGLAQEAAIETALKESVLPVAPGGTFSIVKRNYQDFSDIESAEDFTDSNANGVYDPEECFTDVNGNRLWDQDRARSGQGGADDVVVYQVSLAYPRLMPLWSFLNQPQNTTVSTETTLRNQPFGDQVERTGVQVCPDPVTP